jgi:hypothetical protein
MTNDPHYARRYDYIKDFDDHVRRASRTPREVLESDPTYGYGRNTGTFGPGRTMGGGHGMMSD